MAYFKFQTVCIIAASALLTACATYPEGWTQQDIANYEAANAQRQARTAQWSQQFMAQTAPAAQTPAPAIAPVGQPSTDVIYCRNLTGELIACRQIN
jgi:hypothetical protein